MPITLTPLGPSPAGIGWAVVVNLQTDFIGPIPAGSTWTVNAFADADQTQLIFQSTTVGNANPHQVELSIRNGNLGIGSASVNDGQAVTLQLNLQTPAHAVLDSSVVTSTWRYTSSEYRAIVEQIPLAGTGLTATQSTQLQQTHDATVMVPSLASLLDTLQESVKVVVTGVAGAVETTVGALFSGNLLDTLTLTELTSGPTGEPVHETFSGGYFAIIVRITTTPPNLVLSTPAADYSRPDLAVLRVFRGEDVFLRRGIHETDYVVYPLPFSYLGLPLSALVVGLPPDLTVDVQWALGVEGQVFLMLFP